MEKRWEERREKEGETMQGDNLITSFRAIFRSESNMATGPRAGKRKIQRNSNNDEVKRRRKWQKRRKQTLWGEMQTQTERQ